MKSANNIPPRRGAEIGRQLHNIIKEEDPTRLTTASMNWAKPHMPFPDMMDVINLNYQGEGIRNAPALCRTKRYQYTAVISGFPRFLSGEGDH